MNILMMGIPGSGKSVQAKKLANALDLCYLTTGEVLRELSKKKTDLGRKIKDAMDKGELFDDEFVAGLIKKRLSEDSCKKGFVSDSYPRHLPQLDYFDPKIERIFYIKLSPDEAKSRLKKRGRMDDTDELISRRLTLYQEKAEEVFNYYKDKVEIIYIDGSKSEDEVHQEILSHFKTNES